MGQTMRDYRIERFEGSIDWDTLDSIMIGYIRKSPNASRFWNELDVFGDTTEFLKKINATPDDEEALANLRENLIGYFERYEYIVLFQIDNSGHLHPWAFDIGDGSGMGYIYLLSNTKHLGELMAKLREVGTDVRDIIPVKINYDLLTGMLKSSILKVNKILLDPPVCNLFINGASLLKLDHERRGLPPEDYMRPDPLDEILKEYNNAPARSFFKRDKATETKKAEALARYLVNSRLVVLADPASGNRLYTTYSPDRGLKNAISCFSSNDKFHIHKTMLLIMGRPWNDDLAPMEACFDDIVDLMNDGTYGLGGILINVAGGNTVAFSKAEILKIARNKDKYLN